MPAATATLIPLDPTKTIKHRNWRGTRLEVWEATSADGRWHFERIEDTGTPWEVTHADFPGWHGIFGSLPKARKGAEAALQLDLEFLARTGRDRYGKTHPVQGA